MSFVALEHGGEPRQGRIDDRLPVFRVEPFGDRRGADDVEEEDRDGSPLVARPVNGAAAPGTESGGLRQSLPTGWAGGQRHRSMPDAAPSTNGDRARSIPSLPPEYRHAPRSGTTTGAALARSAVRYLAVAFFAD